MKKYWGVFLLSICCMVITVQAEIYTYDDLNRLIKVTYESGVVIQYTYDKAGNITEVKTVGGTKEEDNNSGNSGNQGNTGGDSEGNGNQGNTGGSSGGNGNQGNTGGDSGGNGNQGNTGGDSGGNGNQGNTGGSSGGNGNQGNNNGNGGGGGNQGSNNQNGGQNSNNGSNEEGTKYSQLLFTLKSKVLEIDGKQVEMDASVFVSKNNRLMVPIRYITYVLDISPNQVIWDPSNKQVVIKGEKQIVIGINKDYMLVDGDKVKLSEKAQVVGGRTYLPIGDICRAFELKYSWDNAAKQLVIY